MNSIVTDQLRRRAAVIGGCAALTLVGLAAHLDQGSQVHAAGVSDGQAISVTTPSATPAITKAVPTITGPAPLYAGEAPDTNPQAQMP